MNKFKQQDFSKTEQQATSELPSKCYRSNIESVSDVKSANTVSTDSSEEGEERYYLMSRRDLYNHILELSKRLRDVKKDYIQSVQKCYRVDVSKFREKKEFFYTLDDDYKVAQDIAYKNCNIDWSNNTSLIGNLFLPRIFQIAQKWHYMRYRKKMAKNFLMIVKLECILEILISKV